MAILKDMIGLLLCVVGGFTALAVMFIVLVIVFGTIGDLFAALVNTIIGGPI